MSNNNINKNSCQELILFQNKIPLTILLIYGIIKSSKLKQGGRMMKRLIIVVISVVLVGCSYYNIYYDSGGKLGLSLEAPQYVTRGEVIEAIVRVRNLNFQEITHQILIEGPEARAASVVLVEVVERSGSLAFRFRARFEGRPGGYKVTFLFNAYRRGEPPVSDYIEWLVRVLEQPPEQPTPSPTPRPPIVR